MVKTLLFLSAPSSSCRHPSRRAKAVLAETRKHEHRLNLHIESLFLNSMCRHLMSTGPFLGADSATISTIVPHESRVPGQDGGCRSCTPAISVWWAITRSMHLITVRFAAIRASQHWHSPSTYVANFSTHKNGTSVMNFDFSQDQPATVAKGRTFGDSI